MRLIDEVFEVVEQPVLEEGGGYGRRKGLLIQ